MGGHSYLQDIIGILEDEQEYIEALPSLETEVEETENKRPVRLLTDAERNGLLEGLGAKREQMAKCFEAMHSWPALERVVCWLWCADVLEEAWKRRVRERYIPEIEQIEKDIVQMKQKYIFVASD